MGSVGQGGQPHLRPDRKPGRLEGEADLDLLVLVSALATARMLLLILLGGTLGDAISRRTHNGGFTWAWNILRWPIAFGAVLVLFALIYYLGRTPTSDAGAGSRRGAVSGAVMWLALSGCSRSTPRSRTRHEDVRHAGGRIILLLWLNSRGRSCERALDAQLDRHAESKPQQDGARRSSRRPPLPLTMGSDPRRVASGRLCEAYRGELLTRYGSSDEGTPIASPTNCAYLTHPDRPPPKRSSTGSTVRNAGTPSSPTVAW